ncbi:hypothetical protein WICMUC_003174 [Wickerhamomyces mucosus]|uniref:Proteasome activator BLM10 n=1 Tax=Wickerhamomyces mucosus TaxID=1378264 RepID=A0A9P8TCQ0_9ASCO|nr:hypothetical protein WICMUC_003174 [Wickerhamomyces mucosus]
MTRDNISAPIPLRNKAIINNSVANEIIGSRLERPSTSIDSLVSPKRAKFDELNGRSKTPDFGHLKDKKVEEEDLLIKERLKSYKLDYPQNYDQYLKDIVDKDSKYFSREKLRKLNLASNLPYNTESHIDQARYLQHILVHLYIAIKSLDLEGLVSISTKDLAAIKSDISLTLDTDFFNVDLSFDYENGNEDDDEEGDEEDDEIKSSGVIGKVLPRSATVVSVNHWTNELKTCLKMKYDLPLTLRAALAKVYYTLALSTGQSTLYTSYVDVFVTLTYKYRKLLTENNLLILNHQTLLDYFVQFFPGPDASYNVYSPMSDDHDKEIFGKVTRLALNSNYFFASHSMREIFDWSLERFSPSTSSLATAVLSNSLPLFVLENESVTDYIPTLFHFWSTATSKSFENHIFELLGRITTKLYYKIAEGDTNVKQEKFLIFTETQMNFLLNKIQNNLRNDQRSGSFYGIAKLLVYTLTHDNAKDYNEKLTTLLHSLETFVHPSNSGSWSKLIARFCHRFITRYHKRYREQQDDKDLKLPENLKITEDLNKLIIDGFLELVLLGSQAKKDTDANYYVGSVCYLADLKAPNQHVILNRILIDLYQSLTDQFVNSNHRITVALKQFTEVSRFMINDHIYRVHITNLLTLLLNKIGSNDLNLTNTIFNVIVTIFSSIQLKDLSKENDYISFESTTAGFINDHLYFLKEHPDEKFLPDTEYLNQAFVASTKAFKDIIRLYIDKLIVLFEADLTETFVFKITQTILITTESLSDELFEFYGDLVKQKLLSGDIPSYEENESIIANLIGSVVKHDNSKTTEYFHIVDKLIRYEIEQGAGTTRNMSAKVLGGDKNLALQLTVMSEILGVSNGEVLKIRKEIVSLIKFIYNSVKNPPLVSLCCYVVHKLLKNLTNIKLRENRLFQKEPENDDYDSRWGVNQFSESRFDQQNLKFDWYSPGIEEISFSVEIFEGIVIESLSKLDEFTKVTGGNNKDLSFSDEFYKNLLFLANSLSGASILFDPDYSNEQTEEDFNKTTLEKKLRILKSLRSSAQDDSELNIDIEQITKVDHDLGSESITPELADVHESDELNVEKGSHIDSEDLILSANAGLDETAPASRLLTPTVPHESDLNSVMNPAIAFRERKIYTSNYFFGSTSAEKKKYFDYSHIHSLRSLIGQGLHKVYLYAITHQAENTFLFQNLLHTMRSYFCDVGKESTFDVEDQLFIDYTFLKKVQSIGNYKKPFSRTLLAARSEKYHRQRIILHSTNRFKTKLDKILLKDVVNLATSAYSTIYQPAQIVMIESLKKLIGSYSFVLQLILQDLDQFVKDKDYKRIEAGLRVLRLRKINKKIVQDYGNMGDIIKLLDQCLKLDNDEVHEVAQKCYNDFCALKVPSAVALFDISEIENSIRPPDRCIDLEVNTVKTAKDRKRVEYIDILEAIQDQIIQEENNNSHWKLSVLHIKLLGYLQGFYELQTKSEVLRLVINKSQTHHPTLLKVCIKTFSKIFEKIVDFARYDYSLENSFDTKYSSNDLVSINTSHNFNEEYDLEMENYNDPKFFIDGASYKGWVTWGKELVGVSSKKVRLTEILRESDKEILTSISELISKEWLELIFKTLSQENESKGMFQGLDVRFISAIIQLNESEFSKITYEEIVKLIHSNYDKDDKASVIVCAEIICGVLTGTKYTSEKNIQYRDQFLKDFFKKALEKDLTPETVNVWTIMFWWIPSRIDFRRVPILASLINELVSNNSDSDLAFADAARLGFATAYVSSLSWKFHKPESLFEKLPANHPYQLVRDQVGRSMNVLTSLMFKNRFNSSQELMIAQGGKDLGFRLSIASKGYQEQIIELFKLAEESRISSQDLSVQDMLHSDYYYRASTLLDWLNGMATFARLVAPLIREQISPFLMNLENNRELCKLGNLHPKFAYDRLAKGNYRPDDFPDILAIVEEEKSSVHQILLQLAFIEVFFSRQLLQLTLEQKDIILKRVDRLLFHSSLEIRTKAASVLSGIIHNTKDLSAVEKYLSGYQNAISKVKAKKRYSNEQTIRLHGSTIGIGALISAFPYVSPPPSWLPDQIYRLSRVSSVSGIVGKSAKDILSNFKKLRAETWHIDREAFTEEQLEGLEGVLWRSYFA